MVCLWFLILFIAPLYGMDGALSSSALLVKAIRAGEHEKVATLIAAEDLINVEIQGSYPLHWAVLSLLKPVKDPASIEKEIAERMKTPSSLLKLGADYLLQERNSGRTIFHTIAFHLSLHSDNKLVLCALDNVLKGICKVWFCKSVAKEVGQQSFIEHMERLYAIKNRVGQSVVEITKQKNCTTFSSKERLRCVYEAAYTELHSN